MQFQPKKIELLRVEVNLKAPLECAAGKSRQIILNAFVYNCNMFVSNTSTLILLAKVDLLGQFIENFGKIEITGEVSKEFSAKDSFDAKFISPLI